MKRSLAALCLGVLAGGLTYAPLALAPAAQEVRAPGDGTSLDRAVILADPGGSAAAVAREAAWLRQHYPGWRKLRQALIGRDGRRYDRTDLESPTGETRQVWFDITDAFGLPR